MVRKEGSEEYKLKFARPTPPYRVFATWNIHYACNYRCSYCHAPKPEHKGARKGVYISPAAWLDIWKGLYDRYGTWEILVSGGEPFVYPGFLDLVIELSKMHFVGACTNLEWDVSRFVKFVKPERVRIETSFHPEFSDLNVFVEKLKILKENGFNPTVNFVPWPPLLDKMKSIKDAVESASCLLTLQPFIGRYESRLYPQGYTDKEKEYFNIFKDECNLKTLNFKTTKESDATKGKLCRMGQNYVFIHPDGDASRCCRDHSFSLGNIIKGSFSLLEEPKECQAENCNCWRCMLVDKEDFWQQHWGRREISSMALDRHSHGRVKRDFKITLVQPPAWGIFEPPVALAQLSSCLKNNGYDVSVLDLNIELYRKRREEYNTVWAIEQSSFWGSEEKVRNFFNDNRELIETYLDIITEKKPDLIGFSVNVCALHATLELSRRIKEKMPEVKIIIGGPIFFVPMDIASILKHDCIDIIVYGESEETLSELPMFLIENKELTYCKGIYFKKGGKIVKTEERPPIDNLDELPFLDLQSFPKDKYDPPGHLGKHVSLMTSRGCILNCVYCGPRAYWRGFRSMSGKRIYDEIRYHIQQDPEIEHVEFLDLELNGNLRALEELCELMVLRPPKKGLKWHANIVIRPQMNRELFLKMKLAGCCHISIGIETGSQRVLDLMRKKYKVEDAEAALRYAYEAGIHVTTNFMFGFPGETRDDFTLTLDFLRRNYKFIGTVYPSRTFCTIEPFSYLAEHLSEFGVTIVPDNNLYWESSDGRNTYPERLNRCEEFSKLAAELRVSVGLGLQTSLELDRYYNLGYYYDCKGDSQEAIRYFSEYLKLDPKNNIINEKMRELQNRNIMVNDRKETATLAVSSVDSHREDFDCQRNGEVSFNWDIHWACNYRCPYCWFYGQWAELKRHNRYLATAELMKIWNGIYERYGSVKIAITGGEPFLYPDFGEFIKELSGIHRVEIITNLSTDIQTFVKSVNSQNVKVNPSFHFLFANFDDFIKKVNLLKENGFLQSVSYLAWPPLIPRVDYYAERFRQYGVNISIQSFFGEYRGMRYPDGYSEEEKKIILPQIGKRGDKPFQTEPLQTKGKLCAAGHKYGVIHPDGAVLRCGGMNSSEAVAAVGNLFEGKFRLFDKPAPCTFEICPCNEWAVLLVNEEAKTVNIISDDVQPVRPQEERNDLVLLDGRNEHFVSEVMKQGGNGGPLKDKVSVTWDIHHRCNYHCPHCWFEEDRAEAEKDNLYMSADKWVDKWNAMHDKYGKINIIICGGEPFLYPDFNSIVKGVSQKHKIEIITNGSCISDDFIDKVDRNNISISLSFYPYIVNPKEIVNNIKKLRKKNFAVGITYIAYPKQFGASSFEKIKLYRQEFKELGCTYFNLTSYWGRHDGLDYPDAYTEEEKRFMMEYSDNQTSFVLSAKIESSKGRLCWAGGRYALIDARGRVLRCGSSGVMIGDIRDDNFKLLEKPENCPVDFCKCSEYKSPD